MAIKIEHTKDNVLTLRCPRCHNRTSFTIAGVQQLEPKVVRLLLACNNTYCLVRGRRQPCGHIIAFEGVVSRWRSR